MKTYERCLNILRSMEHLRGSRFAYEEDLESLNNEILNFLKDGNYRISGGESSGDDFGILFPNDTLIIQDASSNLMYFYDDLRVLLDSFPSSYMEDSMEKTIEKYKKEFRY